MSGSLGFPRTWFRKNLHRALGVIVASGALACAGCRQDMHDQPKYIPLRGSNFFDDGRSARSQVEGTVARSQGSADSYLFTGLNNGGEGDGFPFKVTLPVLHRGQERFNIYCSPCHSRVGDGKGILVQRGYYQAADFHTDRLREASAGHFFNVITNGYGAMPNYRLELSAPDRWAVVAYIKALQLSQNAKEMDAASGANFARLNDVAANEGLPASLASSNWGIRPISSPPVPVAATPLSAPNRQGTNSRNGTTAGSSEEPRSGGAKRNGGDELAANTKQSALPASPGNAGAGQKIYNDNCMMCHQQNRAGMPPIIPSLVNIVSRTSPAHVRDKVVNGVPTGKPPMPSFADKLSAADINNLIAFLKTNP